MGATCAALLDLLFIPVGRLALPLAHPRTASRKPRDGRHFGTLSDTVTFRLPALCGARPYRPDDAVRCDARWTKRDLSRRSLGRRINSAPFSSSTACRPNAPILALGLEPSPMSFKDTARHAAGRRSLHRHSVSQAAARGDAWLAAPFAAGTGGVAGGRTVTRAGSDLARPWIKEAPAVLRIRRHVTLNSQIAPRSARRDRCSRISA